MELKKFIQVEDCYFDVMQVVAISKHTIVRTDATKIYVLKIQFSRSTFYEITSREHEEIQKLFKYTLMEMEEAFRDIGQSL